MLINFYWIFFVQEVKAIKVTFWWCVMYRCLIYFKRISNLLRKHSCLDRTIYTPELSYTTDFVATVKFIIDIFIHSNLSVYGLI